ncbi:hypothetical protein D3C80_1928290 [compost metagenome]
MERWRPPVIPSATTADSNDSTPARKAMVNELGRSSQVRSNGMCGTSNVGRDVARLPNRVPMDSTGSAKAVEARVQMTSAIRNPGQFGQPRRAVTMMAMATSASDAAAGLAEVRCAA